MLTDKQRLALVLQKTHKLRLTLGDTPIQAWEECAGVVLKLIKDSNDDVIKELFAANKEKRIEDLHKVNH